MDALQDCAKAFKNLLSIEYHIIIGRKKIFPPFLANIPISISSLIEKISLWHSVLYKNIPEH